MATAREGVRSAGGGVWVENSCGKTEAEAEKPQTPSFLTLQVTVPGRGVRGRPGHRTLYTVGLRWIPLGPKEDGQTDQQERIRCF